MLAASRKNIRFLLVLGLIALAGSWLLKISTPFGMGLTDDAVSYIAAARAILNGQGFTRIWLASGMEPIVHWPPLFPASMAAVGLFGLDPARGARVVNVLLFGANSFLLGLLGWRMTRSRLAGVALAGLFLVNSTLLRLHAFALSEPLYLFLSLLGFLALAQYLEREKTAWLVGAGIATGLAYLARYAALTLLATFVAALFVLQPGWRKRIRSILTYLGSALPWMVGWMLRNEILAGSATNRSAAWHPITAENAYRGVSKLTQFMIPIVEWWRRAALSPGLLEVLAALIAAAVLGWVLWVGLRWLFKPGSSVRPETLSFTTGLYVFSYMGALLVSISLFDAATPLNDRILSPVYVSLLILLAAFGAWLWRRDRSYVHVLVTGAAILVFLVSGAAQYRTVQALEKTAQGFASWRWRQSSVMEAIRNLPDDVMVYTNQPAAVYFWTDRPAMILPPVDMLGTQGFQQSVAQLKAEIRSGDAVLVLWNTPADDLPEHQAYVRALTTGLVTSEKSGLGDIYAAP